MRIDCSALTSATQQLERSLAFAVSPETVIDPGMREQARYSVIHCFNFTYDLSWKMLKRFLEATEPNPADLDLATFQTLIRLGNKRGLLRTDWTAWKTFRQARTDSRHTYNQVKALKVFAIASEFLAEAKALLTALELRS